MKRSVRLRCSGYIKSEVYEYYLRVYGYDPDSTSCYRSCQSKNLSYCEFCPIERRARGVSEKQSAKSTLIIRLTAIVSILLACFSYITRFRAQFLFSTRFANSRSRNDQRDHARFSYLFTSLSFHFLFRDLFIVSILLFLCFLCTISSLFSYFSVLSVQENFDNYSLLFHDNVLVILLTLLCEFFIIALMIDFSSLLLCFRESSSSNDFVLQKHCLYDARFSVRVIALCFFCVSILLYMTFVSSLRILLCLFANSDCILLSLCLSKFF